MGAKSAVVIFPGSNCDRDMIVAFAQAFGEEPARIWHKEDALPEGVELVGVPGGFTYGDYLRPGAIAARAPAMRAVAAHAARGGHVLGVCNGWQILIEAGILPGALMRNAGLAFVSRDVTLRVERGNAPALARYAPGETVTMPVAHHDGCFFAEPDELSRFEDEGRVAFRYVDPPEAPGVPGNPNGSLNDIAGMFSENGRVLGMMPHPERASDRGHGGSDGARVFQGLAGVLSG